MKKWTIFLFFPMYLQSLAGVNKDSTYNQYLNTQFYLRSDFNFNMNFNQYGNYHIFNSSIGVGVDYKRFKAEILFPFVNYYDSSMFFKKSYCLRAGINIRTKSPLQLAFLCDFQQFLYEARETVYENGYPNVRVPITFDRSMNIKRYSLLIRLASLVNKRFAFCFDFGFSLFDVKQEIISVNDGSIYEFYHELIDNNSDFDAKRLNLGIGLNYLINNK